MKKKNWVFAYGSLINPASASATLGRDVPLSDMIPVWLEGWQRSWCVTAPQTKGQVFLGIKPVKGERVLGVLLRAYSANRDLEKLDSREGLYRRVEVDLGSVTPFGAGRLPDNSRVMTYVPHFTVHPSPETHFIRKQYALTVTRGIQLFGEEFVDSFECVSPSIPLLDMPDSLRAVCQGSGGRKDLAPPEANPGFLPSAGALAGSSRSSEDKS